MVGAVLVIGSLALIVGCFAIGVAATPWRTVWGLLAICAVLELPPVGPLNALSIMLTCGPWTAGVLVRAHRRLARRLDAVAAELEAERTHFAAEQLHLERVRLARELHDTVAHWLTAVVVQAVAGQVLVATRPELARQGFDRITDAARHADSDVQRAVALTGLAEDSRPQALRLIEDLVAGAGAAGVPVTLTSSAWTDPRAEVAAAVVRLVQEGITNAVKHAPQARIDIHVVESQRGLEVDVSNHRPAGAASALASTGSGFGLRGLRERAEALGGTFEAGPTPDGGFRLTAFFPTDPPRPESARTRFSGPGRLSPGRGRRRAPAPSSDRHLSS